MLENKRERLKTFLRKIDEKAIVRIKHFMKESQTFDEDSKGFERTEGTGSQSSFIKHNKTFHKLFPDIPESEDLIHYLCALQKEVPYHGRLYITDKNVCFYSSVLLKDTKVVVPVSSIHIVKKQNTALLVPNAVSIRTTDGDKYLFVSLRNREGCYQLLRSVCPQIEDGSTNSSPIFSSAENSFEKSRLVSAWAGGSWVWSVTDKARSLFVQREASTLNTLLFIYLIRVVLLLLSSGYIGLRIVALEEQLTSLGALPEFTLQS
uniref:GRAM domain-containing protein n=1 Tax=Periophthalmus magnuspinnatus TaxID=409849 RepID=A0A3B4AC70_9GOBI